VSGMYVGVRWHRVSALGVLAAARKLSNIVIGWVTGDGFGRHVKPLVKAAFAVVGTHQSARCPRGVLRPALLVGNP
jgi:hypothetical protein